MSPRKTNKYAHKAIHLDKRSHQEVFDELNQTSQMDQAKLAALVSKIPSSNKTRKYSALRIIFVIVMMIILILKLVGIFATDLISGLNPVLVLILLLLSLIVPVVGIVAALTGRANLYTVVGVLLLLSIFRSIRAGIEMGPEVLIGFIPVAIGVILAFVLANVLKTKYEHRGHYVTENGEEVFKKKYVFDEEFIDEEGLLDSNF